MKNSIYLFLILVFLVGCVDSLNDEVDENSGENNNVTEDYSNNKLESQLLTEFNNYTSDAVIADKRLYDFNDDGEEELLVLFSTKEEPASLAIVSKHDLKGISLNGDTTTNFKPTNMSTLKILDNPIRVLFRVTDFKKGVDVDFEIQVTYNKEAKHTHFIVNSEDVE
ncbi:hypothetical protein [Ureibacillus massiliensis]|nr:hypothetical protein [Ureibacillus massiliensis]